MYSHRYMRLSLKSALRSAACSNPGEQWQGLASRLSNGTSAMAQEQCRHRSAGLRFDFWRPCLLPEVETSQHAPERAAVQHEEV